MTVQGLIDAIPLTVFHLDDPNRPVEGGYCGDLLSWVMSRAQSDDCWFTVMGNINAIAVSVLADCACIVLCENAPLDAEAKTKAEQQGVNILSSDKNAFVLASALGAAL